MSKEGAPEPDLPTDPIGLEPTLVLDGFKPVGDLSDTPAPDGWRSAMLDRFGLAASVLVHMFLVLWAIGWLASAQKPAEDEVITVTLVPEEIAEPEEVAEPAPPSPPEDTPRDSETSAAPKPQATTAPPAPPAPPSPPTAAPPTATGWSDLLSSLGVAAYGRPTTLSKAELDAVKAQAMRCWDIPAGWTEPRQISVTVRFQLNPNGTLKGTPSVVEFPANELGKAAALNAVRAVVQCGPFALPADKYDQWNDIQLRFEP